MRIRLGSGGRALLLLLWGRVAPAPPPLACCLRILSTRCLAVPLPKGSRSSLRLREAAEEEEEAAGRAGAARGLAEEEEVAVPAFPEEPGWASAR